VPSRLFANPGELGELLPAFDISEADDHILVKAVLPHDPARYPQDPARRVMGFFALLPGWLFEYVNINQWCYVESLLK
jgi:hypothetical protein